MLAIPIRDLRDYGRALLSADLVEIRFDLLPSIHLEELKSLDLSKAIFTVRKMSQGGSFQGSEHEREALITKLINLQPAYFDIEEDASPSFIEHLLKNYPSTKLIGSSHNFKFTPEKIPYDDRFHYFKFASYANSTLDSLRILEWIRKHPQKVIGIAMGEHGIITRILAKSCGSALSFASLDEGSETAPGQMSYKELNEVYRYQDLNHKTAFYGVIGKPVSQSLGAITHNGVMREKGINGVYVRMEIDPSELASFFPLAQSVGFKGLSVTMPLKEAVIPFMSELDEDSRGIQAVNTVQWVEGKWKGYNTDGIGCLKAIGDVAHKKVIIIGAGGASKAIAYSLRKAEAQVIVLGRSPSQGVYPMDKIGELTKEGYDILINATPDPLPIDPKFILKKAFVMDIKNRTYPSSLLDFTEKGLNGLAMYRHQAAYQDKIWFGLEEDEAFDIIKKLLP